HSRILLGNEKLVRIKSPVTACQFSGAAAHVYQLRDHFVLACFAHTKCGRIAVSLNVFAKLLEAAVTEARSLGSFRINLVQIVEHRARRRMETVEIHAIEAGLARDPRQ